MGAKDFICSQTDLIMKTTYKQLSICTNSGDNVPGDIS